MTWLDVPNLTWHVSPIVDVVQFTNLTNEPIGSRTLTGVTAFAQLADDVRAVINYLHENEVIPGFYIDPVGVDTTVAQQDAITRPAVDLGSLPEHVFQRPVQEKTEWLAPRPRPQISTVAIQVTIRPRAPPRCFYLTENQRYRTGQSIDQPPPVLRRPVLPRRSTSWMNRNAARVWPEYFTPR